MSLPAKPLGLRRGLIPLIIIFFLSSICLKICKLGNYLSQLEIASQNFLSFSYEKMYRVRRLLHDDNSRGATL